MNDISPDFVWNARDSKLVERIIRYEGTPQAILEFERVCDKLTDYTYWYVLGTLWVSYTGWSELALWKRLLASQRPKRLTSLMKPTELAVYASLANSFICYRAHRPDETDWIAYTLSAEKAAMFSVKRQNFKVTEYRVDKTAVTALFLRRGELEVIILDRTAAVKIRDLLVMSTK